MNIKNKMKKLLNFLAFWSIASVASAQCISGDCNNGFGMYKGDDYVYEGQFKNAMPHGRGRIIKEKGDLYEGGFEYGMYNGIGTLFGADSSTYKGSFHQGIKQGKGKITYADGKQYEGLFSNNRPITTIPVVHQLNFFSGELEFTTVANIENVQQKINTDNGDFDLNNGMWLPSDKKTVFKIKDQAGYYYGNRYYYSKNGNTYEDKKIPYPTLEKKVASCNLLYLTNLEDDNNYIASYLVSLKPKHKKDYEPHREVRIYRINKLAGTTEEINRFETLNGGWAGYDDYGESIQSNTGVSFLLPRWGIVYSNYGKNDVQLESSEIDNISSKEALKEGSKHWFSENGDTLYRLDKGLRLTAFDAHTGKIIRTKRYSNNHFNTEDGGYNKIQAIIGFSEKTMKYVVIDGMYLNYIDPTGKADYGYNKMVLLDLNDPDYMLPLQDPTYTREYYDAVSRKQENAYARYKAFQDAERQKILDKFRSSRNNIATLSSDLDESENTANRKTRKGISREDMDKIIKSNSSSSSGESGWDKYFRERERQLEKEYKMKNDGY